MLRCRASGLPFHGLHHLGSPGMSLGLLNLHLGLRVEHLEMGQGCEGLGPGPRSIVGNIPVAQTQNQNGTFSTAKPQFSVSTPRFRILLAGVVGVWGSQAQFLFFAVVMLNSWMSNRFAV